ncbi:hypothetical protein DB30_05373 [Enhygromyxa salina]|uniref:Uncharacterized protein n=1 Tax=Enhygromyxa salina TaxID=215803 RepID=A0A0C2D1C8_9BACT|nr:hypothetical protein DB30_05373 [Enhygromyxa salina]
MAGGQDDPDGFTTLALDNDGVRTDDEANALFFGALEKVERAIEDRMPVLVAAVFARCRFDDNSLNAGCNGEVIDIG